MSKYVISSELRDTLLAILGLLQKKTRPRYWKNSGKYSNELRLENGESLPLPFLNEIINDLKDAEEVIETEEYDMKVEELLFVAREMGLL